MLNELSSSISSAFINFLIREPPILDPYVVRISFHSPEEASYANDDFLHPRADAETIKTKGGNLGLTI